MESPYRPAIRCVECDSMILMLTEDQEAIRKADRERFVARCSLCRYAHEHGPDGDG